MKKRKVLRVFEGFAGYGGGHFALSRLKEKYPKFEFEVIGYSEIDKYACELYDLNHKNSKGKLIKNFGDITKLNPDDVPDFDIFMGGFPCQPFSTAGMQKGVDDPYGRGTLFQHIIRICETKKPKYILLENVKGFFSKKFVSTREQMEDMLRNMGYVFDAIIVISLKDYLISFKSIIA